MSYLHQVLIVGVEADHNDTFNDIVVTQIYFLLNTLDLLSNNVVVSPISQCVVLPLPLIDTFIPYQSLDKSKYLQWINDHYDLISLQNSNILMFSQ